MSITIKDIAKIAGVSTSTVSLVISGKGYISDHTRDKVQKVIDEYNYRPLRAARQLPSNRTGNIGFIISDVHLSRSEAFYSRILLGAELEARNFDSYILLSSVPVRMKDHDDLPRFLKGRDVDGVIIAGSVPDILLDYVRSQEIPAVLIDYNINDHKFDRILMDNLSGITQAVNHLIETGVNKIGFLGGSFYHPSIQERLDGYTLAMERKGLGHIVRDTSYIYTMMEETTTEIGASGIQNLLSAHSDLEAVICVNDTTAIGCLQYLNNSGLSVPGDISVIGFDDVNYAAVTHPPLTTVHVPKIEMGVGALKMLMDRIDNPGQLFQTRLIPVELIVRGSTRKSND